MIVSKEAKFQKISILPFDLTRVARKCNSRTMFKRGKLGP